MGAGLFIDYRFPIAPLFSNPLLDEIFQSKGGYFLNEVTAGYLGGLSTKKYFGESMQSVFQCDLFFRYWRSPENRYTTPLIKDYIIEINNAKSFGLKLQLGREWYWGSPARKFNLGLYGYFGAGFRLLFEHTNRTIIDSNNIQSTRNYSEGSAIPSLQLGLNLLLLRNY